MENNIRSTAATRKIPTPTATARISVIFDTDGTCPASTCRSGSDIVMMKPSMKHNPIITGSRFDCAIRVPIRSPIGVIDISAPSVKNIIPTTRRIAPIIKAIRMPGGTGAIVKLNINTIAMIGTTASNDSFNFSDNFVRYKFNKYSCLSVLIILQFSDYSIYSLYYHRIPILSIFLLLRSC